MQSKNISHFSSHKNQKLKTTFGFTLIELIVTITIIAIISAIGFVSMQGYYSGTRDSVRISALSTLYKGFLIAHIKGIEYPNPEEYANIIGVSKQGYMGDSISRIIKIYGPLKDPLDSTNYIYTLDPTAKKIQLSTFLEENNPQVISATLDFVNQAYAS